MTVQRYSVDNGDTVYVTESVIRGSGPQGASGPEGPPGVSGVIMGRYDTALDIPANVPNPGHGDGYIADDTGDLYVWDAR